MVVVVVLEGRICCRCWFCFCSSIINYPRAALTMDCSTHSVTVTEEQTWASSRVYNFGSRILFTWQMPVGFGQGCLVKVLT